MSKKYTITAALPYANGALHLGHLAGVYIPADIYARFLRLQGEDVAFVCGSDEHGAAITMRAKKEGISPQEIIDKYHHINKSTFEKLGISFDIYHRTSDPLHHQTAQEFFKILLAKGDEFEEKPSEQYYDEQYKQFLADRYIMGTCPKCGFEEAYGDQCESCGSDLSPTDLIKPRSTLSGQTPVLKSTTHWYFRLDKHTQWLTEWIKNGKVDGVQLHDPKEWREHVVGQCLSWLDGMLQPRAITRDLDWGVPVPVENAQGKVLYVWFDAPIGYISATKAWAEANGKNWEDYWKGDQAELVHFIGKDNIVFHCVIFPAMLKAHGKFVLPINVPANQFLNLEGRKFSKSRGWVIEQHQYLEDFKDFANKEDALRYALIRILPENGDGDFKWDDFVATHDNELADNLGNFINRVLSLSQKYFNGQVPAYNGETFANERAEMHTQTAHIQHLVRHYQFKDAMIEIMKLSSKYGNTFLQDKAPWKLYKEDPNSPQIADTLGFSLEVATVLSVLIYPFLPFTSNRIRQMLGMESLDGKAQLGINIFDALATQPLTAGHQLGNVEILFAKINDKNDKSRWQLVENQKLALEKLKQLAAQVEQAKAEKPQTAPAIAPLKTEIEFPDFDKMDLRVGKILTAERVAKSDKLLKLSVDLGFEQRTVLSGIAQSFAPEQVIGQQVVLVANLKPRKMMGVESHGMILMAENEAGKLVFVSPQSIVPNGITVK